jgi:N-acetylmuramoyl-L-alanine amidase
MRIYLSPSNQYANMYRDRVHNEKQMMEQVALALYGRMQLYEVECFYPKYADLTLRTNEANALAVDYYLAIHSNAYNGISGAGCEVGYQVGVDKSITVRDRSKAFATRLCLAEASITTTNTLLMDRGIKSKKQLDGRDWNGELRRMKYPACIMEVEFHDTVKGCAWILANVGNIARALEKAIVQQTGIKLKEIPLPTNEYYYLKAGRYVLMSIARMEAEKVKVAIGQPVEILIGQVETEKVV